MKKAQKEKEKAEKAAEKAAAKAQREKEAAEKRAAGDIVRFFFRSYRISCLERYLLEARTGSLPGIKG